MKKTAVQCAFRASPKCKETWESDPRVIRETLRKNDGKIICVYCSRTIKSAGRRNPNAKWSLDDGFFNSIDSEEKAYLLGWIASDGSMCRGTISLYIHENDRQTLQQLRNIVSPDIPIKKKKDKKLYGFSICSKQMVADICGWLRIAPGKKDAIVQFPKLPDEDLQWAFLRGYFDGDGCVISPTNRRHPRCDIASNSTGMLNAIRSFSPFPSQFEGQRLVWYGNSALDFMGKLYSNASIFLNRKYETFQDWSLWVPGLAGSGTRGREPLFKWVKAVPEAIAPKKQRISDSGYDLTLIGKVEWCSGIEMYRTGIKVQPAYGWYFDVVPRSSIIKTGYILACSVGVIDSSYVGEVMVPLIKVNPAAADLPLPARVVQLIPRPIIRPILQEVTSLDISERGEKGFGSTGTL